MMMKKKKKKIMKNAENQTSVAFNACMCLQQATLYHSIHSGYEHPLGPCLHPHLFMSSIVMIGKSFIQILAVAGFWQAGEDDGMRSLTA